MDTEESLHLPEEILEEILVCLPVKSLSRFRCVSKTWLSLIDSKQFIKSHLQYSTKNTDFAHHRVLIGYGRSFFCKKHNYKQCSLRALVSGTDLSPLWHPISTDPITLNPYYNSCCCNGLLCFYEGGRFVLLNPTTRVSKVLPKDPDFDKRNFLKVNMGLGWDESRCAYKVFVGWKRRNSDPPSTFGYKSRVYTSKTNSWKTVEEPHLRECYHQVGKFVGGKLHWLSYKKDYSVVISSFDVKSEVFGTIELPGGAKNEGMRYFSLGVVGNCLCFSKKCNQYSTDFHVWVMKESWEKLPTFHLDIPQFYAQVIGEAANGGILITHGYSLFVFCPINGVILHQTDIGHIHTSHLYVESLVSPVLH